MRHRCELAAGVLAVTLGTITCGGSKPATPVTPTPVPPLVGAPQPAPPSFLPGHTLRDVSLSGVVYELTPTGRTPIAGAGVYCEPCGTETHSFATADDSGYYHFPGDLASGGGVWVAPGVPTPLSVGSYNPNFQDPPGLPALRQGPGWREVLIDGDTRFDIELVRRAAATLRSSVIPFPRP